MQTRVLLEKGDVSPSFARDDRIFLGEGLFETLRVVSGKPCFAELHWQRLHDSACALSIAFNLTVDDWHNYLLDQIKRDNLYHGGIKAILSGGSAPRGLAQRGQVSQLMLQSFNYCIHTTQVKLISSQWVRDKHNPAYRHKSVNYLEAIIARRQALDLNMDDVLFFNTDQHATETTCANLFMVKDNQISTPPISDGLLPGITRDRIIKLCEQHAIKFRETSINLVMLAEADAVFICNTLHGIRKVQQIDAYNYASDHALVEDLIAMLQSN